ncbi:alpha/beta hydrolase [Pseudomonas sp. RIT-PI-S]|uniref:alpha/beta hydrolase n=1 Tax=Pseudomonas sp. RIT-PI-S TaxID=3035295 RepID=UPI0021D960E1|nr:alpha/beta hydrolase [Pseudomonas sp. RIT-PI-S]
MTDTFHPERLRASLRSLSDAPPLCEQGRAYQRFYGLDLPDCQVPFETRLGRFEAEGFELVCQAWLPRQPRGTLVLLHGFYDHMGLFRHVIGWALRCGLAVVACDLPGHGLSSGPRASIQDFAHYQSTLDGLFAQAASMGLPRPWHLLGQSTGGAIIIDHALHSGSASPVDGHLMLLAPLVRPRAWGWSRLSYRVLSPFVDGVARRFSENSSDPAFLPFLQADPLQPLRLPTAWVGALVNWVNRIEAAPASLRTPLIVQGEQDMTVDWRHNLRVLDAKFKQPQVLRLPLARHHLANEAEHIRELYLPFLEKHL